MIADCVRSHRAWLALEAECSDGRTGRVGAVDWAWVPASGTMHLLFPAEPEVEELSSAASTADGLGAGATVLWSARDRALPVLREAGFVRGWQPWWMQARSDRVPSTDGRARLVDVAREHDAARAPLVRRPDVLLAEAFDEGRYAGRAWLHLDGEVAGLYDVAVWSPFRRRGLGRALLGLLASTAASRGAERIVLNATPEGATLYAASGFSLLGAGRTWWRRP